VRKDYIPLTDSTAFTLITIQFDRKDLQYKDKQGLSSAFVEVYASITTIARKFVTSFDDPLAPPPIPTEMLGEAAKGPDIFQKTIPLKPGLYRLDVTAKDVNSGNTHRTEMKLEVPRIDEDHLSSSSLILADQLERVDKHSIGTGHEMFVIGNDKVRPRMPNESGQPSFKRDEVMGIYLQLYNFEPDLTAREDGGMKKADGIVTYEVVKNDPKGPATQIAQFSEEVSDVIKRTKSGASDVVVEQRLHLDQFEPGQYTLKMTAVDRKRNQTVTQSAPFTVN
jgi:hypothetical protein